MNTIDELESGLTGHFCQILLKERDHIFVPCFPERFFLFTQAWSEYKQESPVLLYCSDRDGEMSNS